jgi:hypothetical protein
MVKYREPSDDQWYEIIKYRGGCNCAYLGSIGLAPCLNCCEPLTEDEEAEFCDPIEEVVEKLVDQSVTVVNQFTLFRVKNARICVKCRKIKV